MSSKRSTPTTALSKNCAHCGEPFRAMPSSLARRKFCGKACVGLSRKNVRKTGWVEIQCAWCGEPFLVTPAWVRNGRRKFCSRTCHAKKNIARGRLGKPHTEASRKKMADAATGKFLRENSSQWKGGRYVDGAGYVHVMVATLAEPMRSLAMKMGPSRAGYILEHRAVAAAKLWRPILKTEVVHHDNGIRSDNRPENLIAVPRDVHSIEHRETEMRIARLTAEVERLTAEVARLAAENLDLRSRLG